MVVDDRLVGAMRARSAERRGQGQRRVWLAATFGSYALDLSFLILFALTGAVSGSVPAVYGLGAAASCAAFYAATASDWNLRLRDPGMVVAQNLCGIALQFAVAFMAPQIAFPWLANLMTVLAFAMIWLSFASSIAIWGLCVGLTGALFYAHSARIGIPLASPAQVVLVWLYFSLVLGRCVFLSIYSTSMRNRLEESRRKLSASMDQVQELVSHDELTKAFNRRSLMARLEQEKSGAERTRAPFSVALFDIDEFKAVNDTFGHGAGDAALKAFVAIAHATMRDTDIFGRYGGEEFLMILTDTPAAAAVIPVDRIRQAVEAHDWAALAPGLSLKVSAGVTGWRQGDSLEALLNRADAALYQAKRSGRNRVEAA